MNSTNSATITFGTNHLTVRDLVYSASDAVTGNPYNCFFDVAVVADSFAGTTTFENDIKVVRQFLTDLRALHAWQHSTVTLNDVAFGSTVTFELTPTGQLLIHGTLYGEAKSQHLQFHFTADQTVLPDFIRDIERLNN